MLLPWIAGLTACGQGSLEGTGAAGDDIPQIGIVEDLRIDGYEEDLVPINWLAVSSTGEIALLQWQDYRVLFYDAAGRRLGAVGREGTGPGEFRRLVRAGWIGDTLWVSDTQLRRSTLISPEHDVVRTVRDHPLARPQGTDSTRNTTWQRPIPYAMYADGGSLVHVLQRADGQYVDLEEGAPLLRISADGLVDEQPAAIVTTSRGYVDLNIGGRTVGSQIPFFPQAEWTVSPDGSRIAILTHDMNPEDASFRILVVDDRGRPVVDRSFPFEPESIPEAVRDSAIEARARSRRDSTVVAPLEAALRDATPTVLAAASQVLIGTDRRIWIGLQPTAEGRPWLVLSEVGEPQGRVLLPQRVRLRAADARHVYAVERDEVDVESMVRYTLGPLPRRR